MNDKLNFDGRMLDEKLAAQAQIADAVKALPEEPLSLAWRSDLNTKLHAMAARRKKLDLFGWIWKPAAGVALAGALAVAFVAREPGMAPVARKSIEKELVNSYVESTASWEVSTDGVSSVEAKEKSTQAPSEWDQEDGSATL